MHGESDFTDISVKPNEQEDSKESPGDLRNTLIVQCEQEYENMINAVRGFCVIEFNQLHAHVYKYNFTNTDYYCTGINTTSGNKYQ